MVELNDTGKEGHTVISTGREDQDNYQDQNNPERKNGVNRMEVEEEREETDRCRTK